MAAITAQVRRDHIPEDRATSVRDASAHQMKVYRPRYQEGYHVSNSGTLRLP